MNRSIKNFFSLATFEASEVTFIHEELDHSSMKADSKMRLLQTNLIIKENLCLPQMIF